jgi:hypothetical protein
MWDSALSWLLQGQSFAGISVDEYLRRLYQHSQQVMKGRRYGDEFRSPLWEFARYVKAHPILGRLSDTEALTEVEKWLRLAGLTWKQFEGIDYAEDARDEFIDNWHNIAFVPGSDPSANAFRLAKEKPLKLPDGTTPRYALFINYAAHLQCLLGEHTILLPCHYLAKRFGCSHEIIAKYQRRAAREGYLTLEKPHHYGKGRQAAEWRFDLQRFPELKARQSKWSE